MSSFSKILFHESSKRAPLVVSRWTATNVHTKVRLDYLSLTIRHRLHVKLSLMRSAVAISKRSKNELETKVNIFLNR
uniref:Ovule protein n=1 Tax=Heterorhabditis bacteriophora TaxID=37862 RepID=A0A1I7XNR7_HETBA